MFISFKFVILCTKTTYIIKLKKSLIKNLNVVAIEKKTMKRNKNWKLYFKKILQISNIHVHSFLFCICCNGKAWLNSWKLWRKLLQRNKEMFHQNGIAKRMPKNPQDFTDLQNHWWRRRMKRWTNKTNDTVYRQHKRIFFGYFFTLVIL